MDSGPARLAPIVRLPGCSRVTKPSSRREAFTRAVGNDALEARPLARRRWASPPFRVERRAERPVGDGAEVERRSVRCQHHPARRSSATCLDVIPVAPVVASSSTFRVTDRSSLEGLKRVVEVAAELIERRGEASRRFWPRGWCRAWSAASRRCCGRVGVPGRRTPWKERRHEVPHAAAAVASYRVAP